MTLVLNSEVLLYMALDPLKLSRTAKRSIEEADRLLVSSLSIWEIGWWNKTGKIRLPMELARFTRLIKEISCLEIRPADEDLLIKTVSLSWKHNDPVDRSVVALASGRNFPLVTEDQRIQKYYKNCIW